MSAPAVTAPLVVGNTVLTTLLNLVRPQAILPAALPPADWQTLYEVAHQHSLSALLYQRLSPMREQVPTPVQKALDHARALSVAHYTFFEIGLDNLATLFRQADIPMVAYKGIPLARAIYDDPTVRPLGDIDIMVRSADLERSRTLLVNNEWEFERAWEIHHNYFRMIGPVRVPVEVHWISQREGEFHIPEGRFWDEVRPSSQGSAFSPEMTLLIIILHSARHYYTPYRQLVDIAHAITAWQNNIDWERVVALANEAQALPIVATVLAMVHRDLGAPLPTHPVLIRLIHSRRIRLTLRYLSPRRLLTKPMFAALDRYIVPILTGAWQPARLIIHDLLPPRELVEYRYGIPANSPLVPFYMLTRPIELIFKHLRKP